MRRDPWNTRSRSRDRRDRRDRPLAWPEPEQLWGYPYAYGRGQRSLAGLAARAAGKAAIGYARWVGRAPESRGLGTALAALYPAGEIAHLAGADPVMMAAFAPPAAMAAAASTWKAHHSRRYTVAAAALAAGGPAWIAIAAATGATSLPVAAGYTAAACASWSALHWSDVLRDRREHRARQVRWQTIALGAGLEHSRLVTASELRTGWRFCVDVRACGHTASQLAGRHGLAERIAAVLGLPAQRVRVATDPKHAGNIIVTVQTTDPWAATVAHPALEAGHAPARRSVMAGPLVLGTDPDTGDDLAVTVYDRGGAWHTFVVAPTGSGKTTLYSNICEQATACNDVLVWAIDLRRGTIPFFWNHALDAWAGLNPDGTPQYDQAVRMLEWAAMIVGLRSAASGGANHVPSPGDPAILILIDEGDTLVGPDSPIAAQARPLLFDIFRGGRSAGVGAELAVQRGIINYTGSKDPHANAGNKIVLRVNRSAEMNNVLPDWQDDNLPDMHSYAPGVAGVALVVSPRNSWTAGRVRDLSDLHAVAKLASRRGGPAASLPAAIADRLPGYHDRHQAAAEPAETGADILALTARHPAAGIEPEAGGPQQDAVVTRLTRHLPAAVEAQLRHMPVPPAEPTSLASLIAARAAINAAEDNTPLLNRAIPVPATIAAPVLQLLDERGDAGARRDEIVALTGKSRSGVAKWLAIMRDHGLIAATGSTSAARYYLPEHAPNADTGTPDDDVA
jgi:hypothetical protein